MLAATLLPAPAWAAPPGDRSGVHLPELQKEDEAKLNEAAAEALKTWDGKVVTPPEAFVGKHQKAPDPAVASQALPAEAAKPVQIGALPVSIGKAEGTSTAPVGTWTAAITEREDTVAADVDGAIITITPPADASTPVDVQLDYTKFRDLYGAEWASRLQLRQLPTCFLNSPEDPKCSESTDIPSTNDPSARTVTATIDPTTATAPAAEGMRTMTGSGGGSVVLAASDSAAGAGGTYKATSLAASGSWTAGGSSGGFTWSYPLTVPPAPAGPTPSIAFSYSSQAVDGKTSATNSQASWVGDGWDYNPGYIERRFRSCSDDLDGRNGKPNNDNAKDRKKSDLCWAGDNVVMSLGGSTTELVRDDKTGQWVPASDDGAKVELKKDAAGNGSSGGEYWVVTTRDGTRYHYGRHNVGTHGDGTSPKNVTDSVFTVPVAGNHSGEPCHKDGAYAESFCNQAWRWNLDYVEDVHGNAMVIDWAKEWNRYARNEAFAKKDAEKGRYVRGGHPTQIFYGLRADNLAGAPAGRVDFKVEERCFAIGETKCGDDQFNSTKADDKRGWWDTPTTLHCKADAANCYISSPTFWSRKRLEAVTTHGQRTEGSTKLSQVDQWTLTQSLPHHRTDTHPPLWLQSITRTGFDPNGKANKTPLPAVTFLANEVDMPNRVVKSVGEATPDFDRLRVETIRTETGGEIHVDYSAPCPVAGTADLKEVGNDSRCFPVRWSPDPDLPPAKTPLEWFNKYVVESVTEIDRVARQPDVTTSYTYVGGAAWAKEDDEFTKPELRTYSQWRGYAEVITTKGKEENLGKATETQKSQTKTRYFRGLSTPGAKVMVKDSTGEDLGEDHPQFQGQAAETITYKKADEHADANIESRELNKPWRSVKTASRIRANSTTPLEAYRLGTERTDKIQYIRGSAARMERVVNTYEAEDTSYGLLLTTHTSIKENKGTSWTTFKESCSKPDYVHNPASNLIGLTASVVETTGDCSAAAVAAALASGSVLSKSRTSYDAVNAFGAAPTKGLPFQVDGIDAAGTGWTTSGRTEYDKLGRAVKTYDAVGNPTTVTFAPAEGPAFSVTTTNALGHQVTTRLDPARGSVLEATDANGRKVTTAYDALGRTESVWTPSQKLSDKAAYTFEYQITEHKAPVVISRTLKDNGTYSSSIAIYDGLLRPRQTQTEAHGGGRLVTDTLYNANGAVKETKNGYHAEGDLSAEIFVPESITEVPSSTEIAYDGLGRAVRTTALKAGEAQQSAITQYDGDSTLTRTAISPTGTTPLAGSRAVRTKTDVLGRTSEVEHYTATDLSTFNTTTYTYDVRGKLAKVTDADKNNWTYTHDARGRLTASEDPDAGKSSFTYNNLDQQVSSTNAWNAVQYTTYDALGRKTALHDDSENSDPIATWTYDTLPGGKGQPVASTRRWSGSNAFKTEVTGYDSEYRPTGSRITIPDLPSTKGVAGSYAYSTTYTPTGKVQSTTLPATVGGLAAEKLVTRYNTDGMVQTMSGLSWYTADTIYSPFGQVLRTAAGNAPYRVWTTNSFDPHTGRVAMASSHRETVDDKSKSNLLSSLAYQYDMVGNPTSITDTYPGGAKGAELVDRQCFTYDAMGQLVRAWTAKSDKCPTTPAGPALTDVGSGTPGDAYYQEYAFDKIGNRTKLTEHDPTDSNLKDETSYAYGVEITGGAQPYPKKQPHALTKVNKTTRTAGSTVDSMSTYAYSSTGSNKTRTIDGDTQTLNWDRRGKLLTATSPGIGSVAITGLSGKCLDVRGGNTADDTTVQLLSCNETKPQQWRITGDTVQALGKCLTAKDGKAVLQACKAGDANQKFTYAPEGKPQALVTGTNQCVTVPNDNAAEGNELHVFTCASPAPTPAQQWSFGNVTTYLYDASGNRIIQETGSSRTLYLGETEITVDKAGKAMDAVRYYSSPGAPATVRRTNGKTTGHTLSHLLTDHHNTATISVDQKKDQEVTRRRSDPYGNPRGSQPAYWPGDRTFLGVGNDDNTTGLTHIGAREYDPTTGRFLTVDPIIDITDPLQMNGYTYANGNPITNSDPTGLKLFEGDNDGGFDSGGCGGCNTAAKNYRPGKNLSYYNDGPITLKLRKTTVVFKDVKTFQNSTKALYKSDRSIQRYYNIYADCIDLKSGGGCQAEHPGSMVSYGVADFLCDREGVSCSDQMNLGHVTADLGMATLALEMRMLRLFGGKSGGKTPPCRNSFVAGTEVLLADGSSRLIEDLTEGDEVLATDPETGETVKKTVTATIYTEDDKEYVDLGIQTSDGIKTITTTGHHPFWSDSDQRWKDAEDLRSGETLRTAEGASVAIASVRVYEAFNATYNLTVADLHTYYVLAGATPVLVHNCGGSEVTNGKTHSTKCTCADGGNPRIPPNPWGRSGGPRHQAVIGQVERDLQSQGFTTRREVGFDTPGGFKSTRAADVAAYDAGGNLVSIHQVGMQTKGGIPVMRESEAMSDIWSVLDDGVAIKFHPYGTRK
ncbi:polymorphic toxin-type HINT domain-containing protein [Streptomyces erythrochromogenes]|uniref:polymorphic toxin-type HINT domain-containing protein n=1 Tax=Streptomyces erythrochromogenes TaxID=285574 RepID=UPI0036C5F24A